jgi:hypothetical protein
MVLIPFSAVASTSAEEMPGIEAQIVSTAGHADEQLATSQ